MVWGDSKIQAFFPLKVVIFADNGFYLKKWDDWKRLGAGGLSLFFSLGRSLGFLSESWKAKKYLIETPTHVGAQKTYSVSAFVIPGLWMIQDN